MRLEKVVLQASLCQMLLQDLAPFILPDTAKIGDSVRLKPSLLECKAGAAGRIQSSTAYGKLGSFHRTHFVEDRHLFFVSEAGVSEF